MSAWLERVWYPGREEARGRHLLLWPLRWLSWGFGLAARLRAALYDRQLLAVHRPTRARVVSVGNLTVGGAGKTPAVIHLARLLSARGLKVAVLSRGYGRKVKGERVLLPGGPLLPPEEVGDEPLLIARACPQVAVLVGPDRAVLARRAEAELGAEVLLLDDGMQHRRLARDLDIVVVDEGAGFGNGALLPRGPLREPLGALRRAGLVWLRASPRPVPLSLPPLPTVRVDYRAATLATRQGEPVPLGTLEGLAVLAFAGIARPERFADSLRGLGARVEALVGFGDHHGFRPAELEALLARARTAGLTLVTTEKDAVRLPPDFPCLVLGLQVQVLEGQERLEAALAPLLAPLGRPT